MTADLGREVADAELVARFRRDPDEFTAVYDRYFPDVYRYAVGRLDVQTGEDIAAETFCVAFAQRDRFDPERGGLRPWLFGIATKLMARHRRKEARHYKALIRTGATASVEGHESRVVTSVAARRLQPQLLKALTKLNQGERDVVLLIAVGQLSHEEVAQTLGIADGTVRSRLSRARKKFQQMIDLEAING
ncbi:RNA polymerase sigma factor [Actinomadura livida]|uniref:RNA polymerase sigma factor n=1 Tax=Actinomadura livida TaxID=79909 RepID=A0A7W7IKM7_9ACTN|nr:MULTISPECIES: RNA polymerase sigma factor [Actinomadura]MBB4778862.1 RNA polymerase sigma-70 factor (ECF subfamily) [Actinomadura catellatispora]GGU26304.1 DNA-directed RNA polymerase sigma-70 factor [Actinomadura livida]